MQDVKKKKEIKKIKKKKNPRVVEKKAAKKLEVIVHEESVYS